MKWAVKEAYLLAREVDLPEALSLISSLNAEISGTFVIKNSYRADRNTYLRKGKLEELKRAVKDGFSENTVLYVYDDLRPRQKVNLMKELRITVKDKVDLILEIFAEHAGSKEAKLQIEMAELLHTLPLIKEWISKSKLKELPGFMGPGRYAVDAYYTHVRKRMSKIRKELSLLRKRRDVERKLRIKEGIPHVAIAGYANAGKTSLFNLLTTSAKPVSPQMFTTLSPKTKTRVIGGLKVAFVDTVGFIRNLPHEVIEAFYTTLEEITLADLTLLVIDSSEPIDEIHTKVSSSLKILSKIGFTGKEIIGVVNKVDLTEDNGLRAAAETSSILETAWRGDWKVVRVSARSGFGLNWLLEEIRQSLSMQGILNRRAGVVYGEGLRS
ncbi:MAG: GTPase HflX [Desulfurococcales archaeon]|nr:GTPase HflX [Desulfurococcales archaeon]